MKLEITQNGKNVLVSLVGRLDTMTSPELEKALVPYFSESGLELVLDCVSMEYVSSAGLRVVLMAHKNITSKGGKFIIKNLSKEVRSVFDMTGFSRILTIE